MAARSPFAGLHRWRIRRNREERRFARAWDLFAKHHLDYLLHAGDHCVHPPACSARDRAVAGTIVQWLGSEVGQEFLRDLGYERKSR